MRSIALLAAGLAIGIAPLVARNLAVGAPAFAVTNRAPETIVESNAVDAIPVGMPVPASMPAILEEAQGSALRAAVLTAEQYEGHWGEFAHVQWLKLWGAFDPREHSDNLDYEYGRAISPVLRLAPGFALVGLFGVAGLVFFARSGGAHRLVLLYVASALGAQLVTVIVGRYRLGTVAVLIAAGAAYAVTCFDRLRGPSPQSVRAALPALAILPVLLAAHFGLQPRELRDPAFDKTSRELEYGIAVQLYAEDGRFDDALAEVERFREHTAKRPNLDVQAGYLEGFVRCAWGEALQARGRTDEARVQAIASVKAFDRPWQDASAWFQLGRLFVEVGDRKEGERWLERYLREDPGGANVEEAHRLLGR
jgi:tetratricopeptide (TPR) repeat protein